MSYADIILPLPLEGLFTYSIPAALEKRTAPGVRVLVPFGRSKRYIGIVAKVHCDKPEGYAVKDIALVMDDKPMVTERQYRLWQWIADYYMSPIGDVFKAAMPAGLKSVDGFRAKKELFVSLAPAFRSEQSVRLAFEMLARSDRQRKVLECYLALSHCGSDGVPTEETTREELMNESHATSAAVSALVKRGILTTYEREVGRLNDSQEAQPGNMKQLGEAQTHAFNTILSLFESKETVLLHGVTSSGKTEVYIHLIAQTVGKGQQVLYLLPEIALTVQIMERLKRVFGNRMGIYHSKYSDAERAEIWRKQLSDNPYDIILGARSAVFLPFRRLGLVVVDEEHETSFKQQDPAPRYHARSVAAMLARIHGAKTLLGTATPSLETYHNALSGKYGLVEMTQRYKGVEMPEIQVVDIKDLQHRKMMTGPFSPMLLSKVREALEHGEQAILFQNRRGFAPMVECRQCGWVPHCQNCDVSLTLHRNTNTMTCHYCGGTYKVPDTCPSCGSTDLRTRGYGTEKIEDCILELFPQARVARMDLDTTRTRNAYERIIGNFASGRTDILIGTQMISKGLDFDRVSVVGILNADSMMNYPDFRAYEHAYMMMAQVAGRAGRKRKRGLVILQTKSPDSPLIAQVVGNNYRSFYQDQMEERAAFRYPPAYRLIYICLKHRQNSVADAAGTELGRQLRQWFGDRILGPDKPAVAKVKTMNIRKIVLKLEKSIDMAKVRAYLMLARQQLMADKRYASLQVCFDVDPV